MKKYKCIKPFPLDKYDDNGNQIEGETIMIEPETCWYVDEVDYNIVGGEGCVRLLEISESNSGKWIEIHRDTLEELFLKVD